MRVFGHYIPDHVADRAFQKLPHFFKADDLMKILEQEAEMPRTCAYRGADRIVQKRRKAGEIRWISKRRIWERVEAAKDKGGAT